MMRKFPKLLAVVLAIAIIICPAMCLTSMAETPANDYTVSYADDVVTVKVDAANGFLVALLRLDVKGFDVNEAGIAVTTTEGVEFGANPDFDADAGVLSLLLAAKDAANINVVTSATVTIPVTKTATDDNYGIKLTTIQAADAGSVVGDVLVAEDFIDFPYVADAEDGTIVDAPEDKVEAIKPCTHEKTTENTTDSTCTVQGSVTVTCDDCGATIFSESLPLAEHVAGQYEFDENYHWNVCTYGCSEKVAVAEHVFDNDADADCICGFTREVDTHVCEFLTYTYVNAATHKEACECGIEQTVDHVYDEDGVCACGANEPKETTKGFVFSEVTYNATTNVVTIKRSAPDASVGEANSAAKAAGNRWRGLHVYIGGKEYKFQLDYTTGAGTFDITGLAFTDMAETIVVSYLITGNDFSYETDSFTVKVFELLEGVKRRDDKVAKMLELYEATKTAESFAVEPKALSEVKGFTYGAISYNPVTCTITINRSAPDGSVGEANSAAKAAGNRWRGLHVFIGSTEHKFQLDYTTGAGTFDITGLAITDICEDITVSYLITGNDFSYETGSVTVAVGDLIAASSGTLADAYNAFMG